MKGRHRHKLIDRNDNSERYPTFFNGETISGHIELKLNSKTLKHKGIKAELHGILEKYGTINKTKNFLNVSLDICRPEEITQEKIILNFNFPNVKLPYESYKGDYATVKYFIRIIIVATYKNAEYEKEFAVVNPFDSSILKKNDEPIRMQVGMKNKLSLSIYFQHKNYNCRGTLKGFILFNYINIPLTFMEVQIVRREVIFGDKKCEPAYVARYELIDGFPTKNERIPIRFFLKSYNLTPTYSNVDNIFCVRYFLNLVIADEEQNRYFKQKEICLFRLYKERKNICNYNGNYNNENEYYNRDEIFITEPIYEEDFSLDYQPAFGGPNNNKQNDNYKDEDDYADNYGINPNIPSINEDESYDFGYNINNDQRNINNNRSERLNDNEGFNKNNNFNINNRNNTFNNNRNNTFNNNRNDENNRINNIINNERDNNYKNRINNNYDDKNNYNRNRTFNNIKNDSNNIFNDNYIDDEEDNKNINNNYNNRNNYRNNNNYFNENDNNYIKNNRNRTNNYNQNRINNKNLIINNNPSNYYSIKIKNNSNTYDENNMFNGDMNDNKNNIINIKSNNYRGNANYINNDIQPIEKKISHSHRNNLMQARISSEEDFKNIFDSLDKNLNKEELKKNIFG